MKKQEMTFMHDGKMISCEKTLTNKGIVKYIIFTLISLVASLIVYFFSSKVVGSLLILVTLGIIIFGKELCYEYNSIKVNKE